MKIRIKGSSVRYRLSRSEVEMFCRTGYISEKTEFNGKTFTYGLQAREGIKNLQADFKDGTITMYFPQTEKDGWPHSEQVGFQHTMILENGEELFLLLEKDFVCMDDTLEDQSDNYPNPTAQKMKD